MRGVPKAPSEPRRPSVSRVESVWLVLRGLWAAEREARRQGRPGGVVAEEIWSQTLDLREAAIDFRTHQVALSTLGGVGLVVGEKARGKTYYRSTLDEHTAVEAELEAVFEALLHGAPELLELARRKLEEAQPPEES